VTFAASLPTSGNGIVLSYNTAQRDCVLLALETMRAGNETVAGHIVLLETSDGGLVTSRCALRSDDTHDACVNWPKGRLRFGPQAGSHVAHGS
jgi:hypothetical protein